MFTSTPAHATIVSPSSLLSVQLPLFYPCTSSLSLEIERRRNLVTRLPWRDAHPRGLVCDSRRRAEGADEAAVCGHIAHTVILLHSCTPRRWQRCTATRAEGANLATRGARTLAFFTPLCTPAARASHDTTLGCVSQLATLHPVSAAQVAGGYRSWKSV